MADVETTMDDDNSNVTGEDDADTMDNNSDGISDPEGGDAMEEGDGLDSNSESDDSKENENLQQKRGLKRKFSDEDTDERDIGKIKIQDRKCFKASRHSTRCRDCRFKKDCKNEAEDLCRFSAFRKLRLRRGVTGKLTWEAAGFCDPFEDVTEDCVKIWLPQKEDRPSDLELGLCKTLVSQLGDQVCRLIKQENEAVAIDNNFGLNRPKYWKKLMEGVREMCDVCATTLFNYHWICDACGFVACVACFKARLQSKNLIQPNVEKDKFSWLYCKTKKQMTGRKSANALSSVSHQPKMMHLTQIIPKDAMTVYSDILHSVRNEWKLASYCGCSPEIASAPTGPVYNADATQHKSQHDIMNIFLSGSEQASCANGNDVKNGSDVDSDSKVYLPTSTSDSDSDDNEESVLAFLSGPVTSDGDAAGNTPPADKEKDTLLSSGRNVEYVASPAQENISCEFPSHSKQDSKESLKTFTKRESALRFPDIPHQWLCSGSLLRLMDPLNEKNSDIFKELWSRGQPVLVSQVGDRLKTDIWTPESFLEEYGKEKSDLINCMNGKVVTDVRISTFWEGFLDIKKRALDKDGNPILFKLKDWPPTEDFAKFSPNRFQDLMRALPLQDYTDRNGKLNLAARLPDNFMKPDLGPKMYIAYGDGNHLEKGTTNLHLDMSDAVNVMVYVGVPKNCGAAHHEAIISAIEDSDCDRVTIERVKINKELPGALWHIYRPCDADKIRDLLNKVSLERKKIPGRDHDPIHDQIWYLDRDLRKRLLQEYNVTGFPIVQCAGDAVFIPAGAPHQVRNLHNCIKIAEDFVSPENVSHCFRLTDEFRKLSDTHANHEDKLQIKNIVYHAVKDALSVLLQAKCEQG